MLFSKIFNSSTVNRIKNINLPECRNCKHFIAKKCDSQDSNYKIEVGRCSLFGTKNVVTGIIEHDYATTCRIFAHECGKYANYYEPKE